MAERWGEGRTRELFLAYKERGCTAARDELIALHLGLVRYILRSFGDRGEPMDDLYQVGCLGLLKAIEGYDPYMGTRFTTYATVTVSGEIKRYFRDKSMPLRVPRGLRTLGQDVKRAVEVLTGTLGRPPSIHEIANSLGVTLEAVLEARELSHATTVLSLDGSADREGDSRASLAAFLGERDLGLENVENQVSIEQALIQIPEVERLVIHLSFYQSLTQREIASILGISQMHVSRLQSRALSRLRSSLAPAV